MDIESDRREKILYAAAFFIYALVALSRGLSPWLSPAQDVFAWGVFLGTPICGAVLLMRLWIPIYERPGFEAFMDRVEAANNDLTIVCWTMLLLIPFAVTLAGVFFAAILPLALPPTATEFWIAGFAAWAGIVQLRRLRKDPPLLRACPVK